MSEIFFLSSTRSTGFGSVCHEPCPTTNFLIIYFRWREGVPTSVLGSQPIIWLLSSSFPCQATRVRSPSTCDPHSFLTVILWWLATVNSNRRIVVIIFLSSQWDTPWQLHERFHKWFDRVSVTYINELLGFSWTTMRLWCYMLLVQVWSLDVCVCARVWMRERDWLPREKKEWIRNFGVFIHFRGYFLWHLLIGQKVMWPVLQTTSVK